MPKNIKTVRVPKEVIFKAFEYPLVIQKSFLAVNKGHKLDETVTVTLLELEEIRLELDRLTARIKVLQDSQDHLLCHSGRVEMVNELFNTPIGSGSR